MSEPRTHTIPADNLPDLLLRVTRLARRAERLHLPAPTVRVTDTHETITENTEGWARVVKWATVEVAGSAPKLAGWRMVAVILRDPVEAGPNIVHVVEGASDPTWWGMADRCDHCNVDNRGRKTLVVVQHDDGTRRIVGSTCVGDFLGWADPHDIAAALSYLVDLGEVLDDGGWDDSNPVPAGELRLTLDRLLTVTAAAIRCYGWHSVTSAREDGGTPTKDLVIRALTSRNERDRITVRDEDHDTADGARQWARTIQPGTSDYLANVVAVAARETVPERMWGVGVSIVASYQRWLAVEAERATAATSVHVGTVGRREVYTGEVLAVHVVETDYGLSAWVTVRDPKGNILKWKASSNFPTVGTTITGKATVKDHATWKGNAQTVVTRWAWQEA